MLLTDLLFLGLATYAGIAAWTEGSLFEKTRARLETVNDRWLAQLLLCPFCLAFHAWIVLFAYYTPTFFGAVGDILLIARSPVYTLSVAGMAILLQDVGRLLTAKDRSTMWRDEPSGIFRQSPVLAEHQAPPENCRRVATNPGSEKSS